MKAITYESFDAKPSLRVDLPVPSPGPDDVVVRVRASSINPVDLVIATGGLKMIAEYEFPVVLGRDFAGIVERIGSRVTEFAPGDLVHGYIPPWNPRVHDGAWAEYILLPAGKFAVRVPAGVSLEQAGVAPLVVTTAIEAVDSLDLSAGQTVVVIGATGGVGTVAVQLAARAGATVIAPAHEKDATYMRSLGVSQVIDRDRDLREQLPGLQIDALIDLVSYSPEQFDAYAAFLKPGGRAVSALRAAGQGPGRTNVSATPTAENLKRVGDLLRDGTIHIPIQNSHRLDDVLAAVQSFGITHKQGKKAIKVD